MSSRTSGAFSATTPPSAHLSSSRDVALMPARTHVRSPSDSTATQPELPPRNPEVDQAHAWPLHTFLKLGALPSAVPCARLHARQILWEWGLESLTDSTELIVSELATNAVHAAQGLTASRYNDHWTPGTPPIRLWLQSDGEQVLVQIWDGNSCVPKAQVEELDAENGRGLLLVTQLSSYWNAYTPERSSGKVVWAVIATNKIFGASGLVPGVINGWA
jgi:anti-sigma regulatory factor (Ser/Thr protein kinase)